MSDDRQYSRGDDTPDVIDIVERIEVTMAGRQEEIERLKSRLDLLQTIQSTDRAALVRLRNRV